MSSVIEDLAALPRFLTVKETCAFLGVSASTVKRFVKSGDLRQWTPERGPVSYTHLEVYKRQLDDTFYMTGDIDGPGAVEMCFTPEQIREHPEYVTYLSLIHI